MKEKSGRTSHGREIMASKWHSGGTQEVSRDPRRHPEAPRRHPDHQGGQGRRKIDESMTNIEQLEVVKTLCFSMFLKAMH